MKKNKNKPGCDFGGFLQTVSPLLGLIPGAGAIAAPVAGMVGGMISQANQQAQQPMMPRQQNTNPYGMAMGGMIDPPKKKTLSSSIGDIGADNSAELIKALAAGKQLQSEGYSMIGKTSKAAEAAKFAKFLKPLGPIAAAADVGYNVTQDNYLRAGFSGVPFLPTILDKVIGEGWDSPQANQGIKNAFQSIPKVAGTFIDQVGKRFASGGYLNQTGPNTQEVVGNNPSQVDGVELPQAYVDHGETISNTPQGKYVFSDILTNPLTGNSFAEDDKKLAMSDKKASAKPYDKEAMNTLKINEKMRSQLAQVNDITRGLSDLNTQMKGMAKGGYMKPSYGKGGPGQPWSNFDYNSFYDFIGRDKLSSAGFKTDSSWGPQHQELWNSVGPQYQQHIGYNPTTKAFNVPDSALASGLEGASVPNYSTGEITNVERFTGPQTDPLTGLTSQISQYSGKTTAPVPSYIEEPKDINKLFPNGIPFQHKRTGPNEVTNSATGVVTRDFPSIPNTTDTGNLTPGPGTDNSTWWDANGGTALQGLGFLARAATIAKRPDKQNLYLNNAPITPQSYDPSQALNRSQYAFNALKANIGNSVGDGARMANLQQGYANQGMNQAQIVNQYDQMNKQAQVNYEQRLAQRQGENNQTRYAVDQIDDQNLGARNNAARALFTDAFSLGSEMNNQKSNQQSVQWLLSAFPELMKLPEFQNIIGKGKTKKGGYYGRV